MRHSEMEGAQDLQVSLQINLSLNQIRINNGKVTNVFNMGEGLPRI